MHTYKYKMEEYIKNLIDTSIIVVVEVFFIALFNWETGKAFPKMPFLLTIITMILGYLIIVGIEYFIFNCKIDETKGEVTIVHGLIPMKIPFNKIVNVIFTSEEKDEIGITYDSDRNLYKTVVSNLKEPEDFFQQLKSVVKKK